jgi:hypothetical protein
MVMLANMSLELQTQHENIDTHIIIMHLKKLFWCIEMYETFKELFHCKIKKGSSIIPICWGWLVILRN